MAVKLTHSSALVTELRKLIDLPEYLLSLDLRMRVNEVVTVTCTFHANLRDTEPVTKRFLLSEIVDIEE